MSKRLPLSRRAFIGSTIAAGGALAVGFRFEKTLRASAPSKPTEASARWLQSLLIGGYQTNRAGKHPVDPRFGLLSVQS
jgi:hypothetical protein